MKSEQTDKKSVWQKYRSRGVGSLASSLHRQLQSHRQSQFDDVLSQGTIIFNNEKSRARIKANARFAVVNSFCPVEQMMEMLQRWQLSTPSVLISITGSAHLTLAANQLEYIKSGLASAARATNAWLFTGGMDVGVMALTGQAVHAEMSRSGTTEQSIPCIGISPWRKVTHRERFWSPSSSSTPGTSPDVSSHRSNFGAAADASNRSGASGSAQSSSCSADERERVADRTNEKIIMYVKRKRNSRDSAGIDPNHTHFFLVDDGKEEWGGEIKLRSDLESELAKRFRLPIVLLVLEGGPGTYETVKTAVGQGHMVVLVKESRGAAQTISEYIEPLLQDKRLRNDPDLFKQSLERRHHEFQPIFKKYNSRLEERRTRRILDDLKVIAKKLDQLSVVSLYSGTSFDRAVLQAVVSSFKRRELEERALASARKYRTAALQPLDGVPNLHRRARGAHPELPPRFEVPDSHVSWDMPWPKYEPSRFTADIVLENNREKVADELKPKKGWADPDLPYDETSHSYQGFPLDFSEELKKRKTFERRREFDQYGRPQNPRGRTGLEMRGLLGKWGANHAADPIVTRFHPEKGQLQMVAIKRRDTGEWAIPGGMVDDGEKVSETVRREFKEEAVNLASQMKDKLRNQMLLDELFDQGSVVYEGYVDDPRNTDNAWMETTAYHFHCNAEAARMLKLEAGDDARSVKWVDIANDSDDYINLYASHKDWVDQIAKIMLPHQRCRCDNELTRYSQRAYVPNDRVRWSVPFAAYEPPPALRESDVISGWNDVHAPTPSRKRWATGKVPGLGTARSPFSTAAASARTRSRQLTVPLQKARSCSDLNRSSATDISPPRPPLLRQATSSGSSGRDGGRNGRREVRGARPFGFLSPLFSPQRAPSARQTSPKGRWSVGGCSSAAPGRLSHRRDQGVISPTANLEESAALHDEQLRRDGSGRVVAKQNRLADSASWLKEMYRLRNDPAGRQSYETPIVWEESRAEGWPVRPLNPRGRTGLTGLGCLTRWGPNHMSECIITRFHPRGVAEQTSQRRLSTPQPPTALAEKWHASSSVRSESSSESPPGDGAAEHMAKGFRPSHKGFADQTTGLEVLAYDCRTSDRMPVDHLSIGAAQSYMLPSFFTPNDPGCAVPSEVRAALLNEATQHDDPETTERLQHLLRELFDGDSPSVSTVYAGYMDDPRNTDHAWIEMTASHLHLSRELGGQLPFGRPLAEGARGTLVWVPISQIGQVRASNATWIKNACNVVRQEHSQPGLLQLVVRWGRNDIAKLVLQDPDLQEQRNASHVQRAFQDALERSADRSVDVTLVETLLEHGAEAAGLFLHGLFHNVRNDSFGYCSDLRDGHYDTPKATTWGRTFRRRVAERPETSRQGPTTSDWSAITPWQERQLSLMASLVKGFDDYGRKQPVVRYLDVMSWAIVVGSLELAHVMWQRTRSPLRAGLVAQSICQQIRVQKHTRERELLEAEERFSQATVGVLDHIHDQEQARRLLTGTHGDLSTIGMHGSQRADVLALSIKLENTNFVAHRHCQNVLDEQWRGRSRESGAVMLEGARRFRFKPNDLHLAYTGELHVSQLRTYLVEMWRIPLVKRHTQLFSMVGFVISFCSVAFQQLCGDLNAWHYIFFVWLSSNAVQEVHQMIRDQALYKSNAYNSLDILIIFMLLLASFFRWLLSPHGERTLPLLSYFPGDVEHTQVSIIEALRHWNAWHSHTNYTRPELSGPSADVCDVSVLVDLLRTLLGVTALPLFIRLFEFFTLHRQVGVLLVCLKLMMQNLRNWSVVMLVLTLGFSVAFSILSPNFHQGSEFQLADTAGPFRPLGHRQVLLDFSAGGPFFLPFWALYGFFEPGEFAAAPGSSSFAPVVLWIYLLVSLVVLVNLLIAMFNDTYHRVFQDADAQWKMSRVQKIKSYIKQYPAPPPFNVPCLVLELLLRLSVWCLSLIRARLGVKEKEKRSADSRNKDDLTDLEAEMMEKSAMERYLESIGKTKSMGSKANNAGASIARSTSQSESDVVRKVEVYMELMMQRLSALQPPTNMPDRRRSSRRTVDVAPSTPAPVGRHKSIFSNTSSPCTFNSWGDRSERNAEASVEAFCSTQSSPSTTPCNGQESFDSDLGLAETCSVSEDRTHDGASTGASEADRDATDDSFGSSREISSLKGKVHELHSTMRDELNELSGKVQRLVGHLMPESTSCVPPSEEGNSTCKTLGSASPAGKNDATEKVDALPSVLKQPGRAEQRWQKVRDNRDNIRKCRFEDLASPAKSRIKSRHPVMAAVANEEAGSQNVSRLRSRVRDDARLRVEGATAEEHPPEPLPPAVALPPPVIQVHDRDDARQVREDPIEPRKAQGGYVAQVACESPPFTGQTRIAQPLGNRPPPVKTSSAASSRQASPAGPVDEGRQSLRGDLAGATPHICGTGANARQRYRL